MANLIEQLNEIIDACEKIWTYNLDLLTEEEDNICKIIRDTISLDDNAFSERISEFKKILDSNIDDELFEMPKTRNDDVRKTLDDAVHVPFAKAQLPEVALRAKTLHNMLHSKIMENSKKLQALQIEVRSHIPSVNSTSVTPLQVQRMILMEQCLAVPLNHCMKNTYFMIEISEICIPIMKYLK